MPTFTNRFGRRPGRGIRPWILLPKVLAFSLYFGGLGSAFVISLDGLDRLDAIQRISNLFEHMVIPTLLAALVLGLLLLLQHPRIFIRMRWLLLKLAILAGLVPSAHFFLSSRLAIIRRAVLAQEAANAERTQFLVGLGIVIVVSALVIILGRLKPRLGRHSEVLRGI